VTWTLYEAAASFPIPGYQTGLVDDGWLAVFDYGDIFGGLGRPVETGSGVTAPDGTLSLELPNLRESAELGSGTRRYSLEVTATDESGLPVSARGEVLVHPAEFYIGVQPDGWSGQAGVEMGYAVQVVDWQNNPAGARPLQASFRKVEYVRQDPPPERIYDGPTWEAQYTDISSVNLTTGGDGKARLAFTAPEPGTYQLEISGDGARTQVLVWVGGPGQALWPNLPNQRLRLTPDQETYQPGETASIFMPNPFPQAATALITVERGVVMRYEVRSLAAGGSTIELPLGDEDAPNVYVSVTLLGQSQEGQADFRQGYTTLEVTPVEQTLQVSLTSQPERLAPGEGVTFSIRVTDASGQPVEGEFSISVVDLAVLALTDPNAADILTAFYGTQPLGVRTSLSLAAYANRQFFVTGGLGGGGGAEAASMVRSDFPDTAYWNATVLTDANGEATVSLRLPDNLTTWQVDVRGLTADTRVGQAQVQVVATKDLLIRPVTPRFLVAGDHALLAAVVQNNTAADLPAQVSLQGSGFKLDESQAAVQDVTVPAGGRVRVTWWGTAQDVNAADLVFSVQAGQYQDAAQPTLGPLPVLRYTASQAFATAGYLEGAVQQLELVSLPRGAQVSSEPGSAGELRVELAPSLAASMLTALDALEYYEYECTEQTLARFLPNLLLHQALQTFNIQIPEVQARLERTLQPGLEKLAGRQNEDGGWGWWIGDSSNAYLTSYVVLGLAQAQQAGADISEDALQRAVDFLNNQFTAPDQIFLPFELDRLAFQYYALAQAGYPDAAKTVELVAERDQLSPWAQALLALALDAASPGSPEAKDLLAGLQASAQRSATGVFWSDASPRWQNMNSTVTTTAMVIYALALKDPASSLLPDAIRFLMAGRGAEGAWASTFETTWALMAATTFMQGTGELGGDYSFQATLNGAALASGQAGGDTRLTPVTAAVPVAGLYPEDPNALTFERSAGAGRLYYRALLDVNLPADQAQALNRGFVVERAYYLPGEEESVLAAPTTSRMTVHLTLVASQDMYYVVVEDFIPAGGEILDTSLKTSQIGDPAGFEEQSTGPIYDPGNPFDQGWGWWFFNAPQIYDDHITWTANFLPAGTYELTYTVTLLQEGEFRLLPARAYQFYFPDVQGNSAGAVFTIQP
jgi:alpha-2-macroglobulin